MTWKKNPTKNFIHLFLLRWVEKIEQRQIKLKEAHTQTKSKGISLTLAEKRFIFSCSGSSEGTARMCVVVSCWLSMEFERTFLRNIQMNFCLAPTYRLNWDDDEDNRSVWHLFGLATNNCTKLGDNSNEKRKKQQPSDWAKFLLHSD